MSEGNYAQLLRHDKVYERLFVDAYLSAGLPGDHMCMCVCISVSVCAFLCACG